MNEKKNQSHRYLTEKASLVFVLDEDGDDEMVVVVVVAVEMS